MTRVCVCVCVCVCVICSHETWLNHLISNGIRLSRSTRGAASISYGISQKVKHHSHDIWEHEYWAAFWEFLWERALAARALPHRMTMKFLKKSSTIVMIYGNMSSEQPFENSCGKGLSHSMCGAAWTRRIDLLWNFSKRLPATHLTIEMECIIDFCELLRRFAMVTSHMNESCHTYECVMS